MPEQPPGHGGSPKYKFILNGQAYESPTQTLTGAQILAYAPGIDPTFSLFLEGHGSDPDRQISPQETVDLKFEHGPRRFFTVPPATFG